MLGYAAGGRKEKEQLQNNEKNKEQMERAVNRDKAIWYARKNNRKEQLIRPSKKARVKVQVMLAGIVLNGIEWKRKALSCTITEPISG